MRARAILFALLAFLASPAMGQETRVAPEGHNPPPATVAQLDWMLGQWVGEGIGGARAYESWLPASGANMVGTFVQETAAGEIMFTEHMYVAEEAGSLVVRLKHFNADLTGWEEKDDMLSFPLLSIDQCAAYFSALTYRCDGDDGMLVAVRMKSDGEEIKELVFRFKRLR